jgi:hypothetical protein
MRCGSRLCYKDLIDSARHSRVYCWTYVEYLSLRIYGCAVYCRECEVVVPYLREVTADMGYLDRIHNARRRANNLTTNMRESHLMICQPGDARIFASRTLWTIMSKLHQRQKIRESNIHVDHVMSSAIRFAQNIMETSSHCGTHQIALLPVHYRNRAMFDIFDSVQICCDLIQFMTERYDKTIDEQYGCEREVTRIIFRQLYAEFARHVNNPRESFITFDWMRGILTVRVT